VAALNPVRRNQRWSMARDGELERAMRRAMESWSERCGVRLKFIEPGNPMQNAFIESFNGRLRGECLSANWFLNAAEARRWIEARRWHDNTQRPLSPLDYRTPNEFALGKARR
jgi:putative transposase